VAAVTNAAEGPVAVATNALVEAVLAAVGIADNRFT